MLLRILVTALAWLILGGCGSSSGVYHTVVQGQTLYRIARDYGVDEQYLARINSIHDPTGLPVGKRLFIPGVDQKRNVPATFSPSVANSSSLPASRTERFPEKRIEKKRKTAVRLPPAAPIKAPETSAPEFDWPVRGKILKPFRKSGPGICQGIEIAVSPGTPVASAAEGRVTYSGNGIRGFGNLVILKHSGSYFTVYGYNMENFVKTGAYVSKGERIALSGSPPGTSPRLHFEIRRGKEAVDPIFFLP